MVDSLRPRLLAYNRYMSVILLFGKYSHFRLLRAEFRWMTRYVIYISMLISIQSAGQFMDMKMTARIYLICSHTVRNLAAGHRRLSGSSDELTRVPFGDFMRCVTRSRLGNYVISKLFSNFAVSAG